MKANVNANIELSEVANDIIKAIYDAGYTAYAVGGCVRDRLNNYEPENWNICTSMASAEVKALLESEYSIDDSDIDYGIIRFTTDKGQKYEIATYRSGGSYYNNGQPDEVIFTNSIKTDLAGRDFTINAMAYNSKDGLIDPYNGRRDIRRKKIRCVGEVKDCFMRDPVRMLRAFRFANTYEFDFAEDESNFLRENRDLLKNIPIEILHGELVKIFYYPTAKIIDFLYFVESIIPELVDEDNRTRIITGSGMLSEEVGLMYSKLANMLNFKDPRKTKAILQRLGFDEKDVAAVNWIVSTAQDVWDYNINPNPTLFVRQLLRETDNAEMVYIFANSLYCMSACDEDAKLYMSFAQAVLNHLANEVNTPHNISSLAITSDDLKEKGFNGSQINNVMEYLLSCVMFEDIENEKDILLDLIDRVTESVGIDVFNTPLQMV